MKDSGLSIFLFLTACSAPFETAAPGDAAAETLPDRASPETGEEQETANDHHEVRADSDSPADSGVSADTGREVWPRDVATSKEASGDTATDDSRSDLPRALTDVPSDAGASLADARETDAVTHDARAVADSAAEVPAVGYTCADRYDWLEGFKLCEDGTTCEFVTTRTANPCAALCGAKGESCSLSWSSSGTCAHGSPFACTLSTPGASHQVCRCAP